MVTIHVSPEKDQNINHFVWQKLTHQSLVQPKYGIKTELSFIENTDVQRVSEDSGISVDPPSEFCSLYMTSSALSPTASRERCSSTGAVGGGTLWKN